MTFLPARPTALLFAAASSALAQEPPVEWRGATPPVDVPAVVVGVSIEGLSLAHDESGAGTILVGWDRVRAVTGPHAGEAAPILPLADLAWRARIRLDRADLAGAEPLLDTLFESYAGVTGPTAGVVSSGLARCRIARGALSSAIAPWLNWVASQARPEDSAWEPANPSSPTPPMVHPPSQLCPGVPPVFVPSPSTQVLADRGWPGLFSPDEPDSGGAWKGKARLLASWYLAAARFDTGRQAPVPREVSDDEGVLLVADIVQARIADASPRRDARQRLAARLAKSPPPWQESWIRLGIGRSLAREDSPELRRLGVVELLAIPALLPSAPAHVRALALAQAVLTLDELGEHEAASRLLHELATTLPSHPVLEDARLGAIKPLAPSATTPDTTKPQEPTPP